MRKISEKELNLFRDNNFPLYIALSHHITHKGIKMGFKDYPYLFQMMKDQSPRQVDCKSTQGGVSEWLLIKGIAKASKGYNVFWVIPSGEIRRMFVSERVKKTIEATKIYQEWTRNMDKKLADSMSMKQIKDGTIFFALSGVQSHFSSFPADDVIIDELDYCEQEYLEMTRERQSASTSPTEHKVGNPTIADFGIDKAYKNSNRSIWLAVCEHCGDTNNPDWFTHVVKQIGENDFMLRDEEWTRDSKRDIHLICEHCGKPFHRYNPGWWEPTRKHEIVGRRTNKLFSSKMPIVEILQRFEAGLVDPIAMQRFYNGDMGMAYTADGSKITPEMLDGCIQDYLMPGGVPHGSKCVMGIDVGNDLHIRINQMLPSGVDRAVYIGKIGITDTAEAVNDAIKGIKALYRQYSCICGVIDSMPEIRLARALCHSIPGMFRWTNADDKKNPVDLEAKRIYYDRNLMLDEIKNKIVTGGLHLPKNAKKIPPITDQEMSEYYDNVTSPTRVLEEYGRLKLKRYVWKETRPDHYAFAEGYAHLAKKIIVNLR